MRKCIVYMYTCIHAQMHCLHLWFMIKKSLLLMRSLTFGKYSTQIWLPIYVFSGLRLGPNPDQGCWLRRRHRCPNKDCRPAPTSQRLQEPCRFLRGSENLAGTADGKPRVFLETKRPQRDCLVAITRPITRVPVVPATTIFRFSKNLLCLLRWRFVKQKFQKYVLTEMV